MATSARRRRDTIIAVPSLNELEPRHPVAAAGSVDDTSSDLLARRAFELYSQRGCEHGHDLEDWLRAERELQSAEPAIVSER